MKQPNWKTPLILSATLFAVGTFAYWLQYSHKPKKEKEGTALKKPISLPSEDAQITHFKVKTVHGLIELKCESLAQLTCSGKTSGKWVITYPTGRGGEQYPADSNTVKDFIFNTAGTVATETIDLNEESAEKRKSLVSEYGLSDEKRTHAETQFVEFTLDGGKRLTAWFGQEHPLGDKTFVASSVDGSFNDKTIFLISNQQKNSTFNRTVTTFREKSLFTFDRKDVTEFKAKVVAERKNDGKLEARKTGGLWTINGYPANYDRIETILSGISNAKAIEFVDQSLIKGLKPIIMYHLTVGEKPYSLALYEKTLAEKKAAKLPAEKHYYAQSSEKKGLLEVEALLRNNIDKSLKDLRNNVLLSDTEKVTATSFKVEGSGYKASPEFTYRNGHWETKDSKTDWDAATASKIVDLLARTRIQDFVSPPPKGKDLLTLSIGDEKNPTKFRYSIYSSKEKYYAKNLKQQTNEAYLMEDSMKAALPKSESEWKIKIPTK